MEWLLSYVDMQFVYLKGVVLFYVFDRFQGRIVSLIGFIPCMNIFEKKSNMGKVLPAMVKVSIIILSFIYSFPVAKLLLLSVWCNTSHEIRSRFCFSLFCLRYIISFHWIDLFHLGQGGIWEKDRGTRDQQNGTISANRVYIYWEVTFTALGNKSP